MTPTEATARAKAAYAQAEAASDPRDKAAWRDAARTWEKLARPGVEWSLEPMRRELALMKREPQNDEPPREPPKAAPVPRDAAREWSREAAQATISF
jgi:hypothetical protein